MENTSQILGELHKQTKRSLTNIEQKRLNNDLLAIIQRLKKSEYKIGRFSGNKFDVEDRTYEFYVYLKFYCEMGKTWTQVLKKLPIHRQQIIVDLLPGYTPKVELALYYANYRGNVLGIDQNAESLKRMHEFMQLFNCNFSIKNCRLNLYSNFKKSYKFIIGNHIIDDLVIDYFCRKWRISSKEIYEKEGKLTELWNKILKDKQKHLITLTPVLSQIFNKITADGGYLLLSQYASHIERALDLYPAVNFNKTLLDRVVKTLPNFKSQELLVKKALSNYNGYFKASECYVLKKNNV